MAIATGGVFDERYQLDRQLGDGPYAKVFLATDTRLGRRVAVKIIAPELATQRDFLARFNAEAQRVAKLDHPNILSIYEYGEAEGSVYLVMPYLDGGTLADKLRAEAPLGLEAAGRFLSHAANALDYAHQRHVVHGDVKPLNMFLRDDGTWLLLADFGMANVLSTSPLTQTRVGPERTNLYIAPEQIQGTGDKSSDIYSLGCVLFEMLTGEPPYAGSSEQVAYGHVLSSIPSIVERSKGKLPQSLQAVFDVALAKQATSRFETAGELVSAYEEARASAAPVVEPAQVAITAAADWPDLAPASETPPTPTAPRAEPGAIPVAAGVPVVGSAPLADPMPGPTVTLKAPDPGAVALSQRSWAWRIAQCWWILLTFWLGFFTWIAFVYIGVRARRYRWLAWGAVYFVGIAIAIANTDRDFSGFVALVIWLVAPIHAVIAAFSFLRRLAFLQSRPGPHPWII